VNRQDHIDQATTAAERAAELAKVADRYAHHDDHDDHQRKVQPTATAGALWADVARAHAAIAAVLPETEPTDG
jgi:hypothetical protein